MRDVQISTQLRSNSTHRVSLHLYSDFHEIQHIEREWLMGWKELRVRFLNLLFDAVELNVDVYYMIL